MTTALDIYVSTVLGGIGTLVVVGVIGLAVILVIYGAMRRV